MKIITAVSKDIGFPVRRLLPSSQQSAIGPFVFFDHMGPAQFAPDTTESDVRAHPHIGLATVTYLLSGAMMHRDSLGVVQRIKPGEINLMTAGSGIVHSERISADIRNNGEQLQGLQMWLALPTDKENMAPAFEHHDADQLPDLRVGGVLITVLMGQLFGLSSPVSQHSPTLYASADFAAGSTLALPVTMAELGIYLLSGDLQINGEDLPEAQIAVFTGAAAELQLTSRRGAKIMILGGEPLTGPRFLWWNFVASSRERIEQAKADWQAGRFAMVPGEAEFIPLPQ